IACHNHRCCLLLPTKLHISSISASSTCRILMSSCAGLRLFRRRSLTCVIAGSFFLSTSMTVAELTLRTRTISRTPLPLSVMSTICCLTAGKRPLSAYCRGEWCADSHDCCTGSAASHWLACHIAPHRYSDTRDSARTQEPSSFSFPLRHGGVLPVGYQRIN